MLPVFPTFSRSSFGNIANTRQFPAKPDQSLSIRDSNDAFQRMQAISPKTNQQLQFTGNPKIKDAAYYAELGRLRAIVASRKGKRDTAQTAYNKAKEALHEAKVPWEGFQHTAEYKSTMAPFIDDLHVKHSELRTAKRELQEAHTNKNQYEKSI